MRPTWACGAVRGPRRLRAAASSGGRECASRLRFAGPRTAHVCRFILAQRKTEICRPMGEGSDLFAHHNGTRAGRVRGRPVRRTGLPRTRPFKPCFLRKRQNALPPIGGRMRRRICSRATTALGQGAVCPSIGRAFNTRPFKSFFLRKRKYTLPPIGGRVRRRICSRASTALGQGAVCPSTGRAFSTRPFKSFFLRKRKYTLPPVGGRVYFGCGRRI